MAEEWARFVAAHAVHLLLGLALLVFLLTLAFWQLVERFGPALWTLIVRSWSAISGSPLAARLRGVPVLGRLVSGTSVPLESSQSVGIVVAPVYRRAGAPPRASLYGLSFPSSLATTTADVDGSTVLIGEGRGMRDAGKESNPS